MSDNRGRVVCGGAILQVMSVSDNKGCRGISLTAGPEGGAVEEERIRVVYCACVTLEMRSRGAIALITWRDSEFANRQTGSIHVLCTGIVGKRGCFYIKSAMATA